MLGLVVTIILILLIFVFVYLDTSIIKLNIFKNIKNKYLRFLMSLIPFVLLVLLFGFINSIVILFHLYIFELIVSFILSLIKKKKKYKKLDINFYKIIIASSITIIYLGIGAYLDFHIFETKYEIETTKDIGKRLRIIQISDSHIGTTFGYKGFSNLIDKISKIDCDLVVITGDYVDDDTSLIDMQESTKRLSKLKPKYGIYFVNGNHDKGYYNSREFSINDLYREFEKVNVTVLEDEVKEINDKIYLIGRKDKSVTTRMSINDLTKDLDKSKYIIDLNHQPNDFENEKNAGVDLVLSGHTHGGQLIPLGLIGTISKANDSEYGLTRQGNTNYIVTSGVSNWALYFKTGTKSEYVIIDIVNK